MVPDHASKGIYMERNDGSEVQGYSSDQESYF